ncbi:MAG: type II secretion system protein GspJ [Bdellovibrionota bacterium]
MKTDDSFGSEGLTLIELVVVAALLALLSALLWGTLSGIIRARDVSDATRTADVTAHYIFSRISNELAGRSFVPLNTVKDDDSSAAGSSSGAPQIGAAPSYLLGTDEQGGERDLDKIRFVSSNAAQPFVGGQSNHGLVEVEYHLAENPDEDASAPPASGKKPMTLVRVETPAAVTTKELIQSRRIILPLAENIVSLNFRYLRNGTWQKDWKETNPPLPEAVEVTLGVLAEGDKVETYRTAVAITSKPKQQTPR